MELGEVLQLPKYHRRTFFVLTIVCLILLILADRYILNHEKTFNEFGSEIIGHIIAGAASAILIVLFLSFFIPRNTRQSSLVQVPAAEITREFEQLLAAATRWRLRKLRPLSQREGASDAF